MPIIEKRYAEALLLIAAQNNAMDVYQQEFDCILRIYESDADLKLFLVNPQVKRHMKKTVLQSIFADNVNKNMLHFLMLLSDKGRLSLLHGIYDEFIKLADEKRGILNISILTAVPLDGAEIRLIEDKFKKIYHAASAKTEVVLDARLIGGVKVKIGDKMIDASINGKLQKLQEALA